MVQTGPCREYCADDDTLVVAAVIPSELLRLRRPAAVVVGLGTAASALASLRYLARVLAFLVTGAVAVAALSDDLARFLRGLHWF